MLFASVSHVRGFTELMLCNFSKLFPNITVLTYTLVTAREHNRGLHQLLGTEVKFDIIYNIIYSLILDIRIFDRYSK